MNPNALVPVAQGSEELEAVAVIDILRRAGIQVTVAAVPSGDRSENLEITASRQVRIVADCMISDCLERDFDAVILPGGMPGAENLRDSDSLTRILKDQDREGRWIGAICASPAVVLHHHGLIRDRRATCYPGFMDQLPAASRSAERVVTTGNLVTSRGPGTAIDFALALVQILCGPEKRDEIAGQLLFPGKS